MKKLLLLLFFILFINSARALDIQNVTITRYSDAEINVLVEAVDGSCMYFYNYAYTISNNTITLNVCYGPQLCSANSYLRNNIQIPINNLVDENFTLVVNAMFYNFEFFSCENSIISDTGTLQFSTPLTQSVTLSNNHFENEKNLKLYPNPTNGILNLDLAFTGGSVSIYDSLARKILTKQNIKELFIDLSAFENGIYMVEFINKGKKTLKKIILQK